MADSNNNSTGGIGFVGLLTIVFIVLKLTDHIDWSWWWVLSPIWISAAALGGILLIILIVALVMMGLERRKSRRRKKARECFAADLTTEQRENGAAKILRDPTNE